MRSTTTSLCVILSLAGPAGADDAVGDECVPAWEAGTFATSPPPGPIYALQEYASNGETHLYVGFGMGVRIIRWDGTEWDSFANMSDPVRAMTVFDDGRGERLIVGGEFEDADTGVTLNHIGAFDGQVWAALDSGLPGFVKAVAVYEESGTPTLFAGGDFFENPLDGLHYVARWTGTEWTQVDVDSGVFGDLNGAVRGLAVFDDGNGADLYATGQFTIASGTFVNRIARWDGSSWSALGSGLDGTGLSLAVHDDGGGPALYVGGEFTSAGGVAVNNVARWDGTSWSAVGTGLGDVVHTLFDSPIAGGLLAGGEFTSVGPGESGLLALWDGADWTTPGGGVAPGSGSVDAVFSFTEFNDVLYAAGDFKLVAENAAPSTDFVMWDGEAWTATTHFLGGGAVRSLGVFDLGDGDAVYAAGDFMFSGGLFARRVARWTSDGWAELGAIEAGVLTDLALFDDGGAETLYASSEGSINFTGVFKWDGETWVDIQLGPEDVYTLAVFDHGNGPELYAGGDFDFAGGTPVSNIARWNGFDWSDVAGGADGQIRAMAVFDDGSGPALYVGGNFNTAGGAPALSVARWDGQAWSDVGGGVFGVGDPQVMNFAPYDDGQTSMLVAVGFFAATVDGQRFGIAGWDGTQWQGFGLGLDSIVLAAHAVDEPDGPALYVGGAFSSAGSDPASNIARWQSGVWGALGDGVDNEVLAFADFDDGSGHAVYVGGQFSTAGGSSSLRIARWRPCFDGNPADLNGDGLVGVLDLLILLGAWGPCPPPPCLGDIDGNGAVGVPDLLLLLTNWG